MTRICSVATQPRKRPANVKEAIVVAREFKNFRLVSEDVAEFDYPPTLCDKAYRLVVIRKNLSVEKGEQVLFDEIRYFFYITNDWKISKEQVVFQAQEKRIAHHNLTYRSRRHPPTRGGVLPALARSFVLTSGLAIRLFKD